MPPKRRRQKTLSEDEDDTDNNRAYQNASMAYKPKYYGEEVAILLDDDLAEIQIDIIRLFPKNVSDCKKLLKTCLIHDETTTAGMNPMQVNLIDLELVPSLLDNHHFEGARVFVLHHELLLSKTNGQKYAIVSQMIGAALEETLRRKRRVVIYIPRLERFWSSFDASFKHFIEEKLMQVSTKPIMIISTTCWSEESLPKDLHKLFKGPASAQHTIGLPTPAKINKLLQRVLPEHEIFKINANQNEGVVQMLELITRYDLPQLRESAVAVASGKTASVVLEVYYALEMYCYLQGSDWDTKEHLQTSIYFLLQRFKTVIDAVNLTSAVS